MSYASIVARMLFCAAVCTFAISVESRAQTVTVLDQIGEAGDSAFIGASSSQHGVGNQPGAFVTIDNFTITEPLRLTRAEGVVTGIAGDFSFADIASWSVQIYTSTKAAESNVVGDAYSQSFATPDFMTNGFSTFNGFATEITGFDIDVVLAPGEYWLGIILENDNGTGGIRGSMIGDGPARFAVSSQNSGFNLSQAAAYRIRGEAIPAPATLAILLMGAFHQRRRRSTS